MVAMHPILTKCLLATCLLGSSAAQAYATPDTSGCSKCELDNRYSAQQVIQQLGLESNPEKGYYVQTFEDSLTVLKNRSASTAIYYLLEGKVGQGLWHQVFDVEIWHHYAGAPLTLSLSWNNGSKCETKTLGKDIFNGQIPQVVIPSGKYQAAQSLGNWTLVGTTVAPGFDDSVYKLYPEGFQPKC